MKGYKPAKYTGRNAKIIFYTQDTTQICGNILYRHEMLLFDNVTHEFIKFYFPIINTRNLEQTLLSNQYIDRCINKIIKTGLNETG